MARQPWHIYPAFLLLATGFACLHTVTLGKIVSIWFIRHRRRAMASATIGAGIGGMTLPLLNATMVERWGGPAGGDCDWSHRAAGDLGNQGFAGGPGTSA